ncbi:hypothetical protein [Amycolatopsis sp. NBC_00438]|uniref:hypothetical protein n=1 Tax=Amycolatopsis sp. NBC_00438 TaxID=2903558 RepID=UPI002E1B24D0
MTDPLSERMNTIQAVILRCHEVQELIKSLPTEVRERYANASSFNTPGAIKRLDSTLASTVDLLADLLRINDKILDHRASQEIEENLRLVISELKTSLNFPQMSLNSLAYQTNSISEIKRNTELIDSGTSEIREQQKLIVSTLGDLRDAQRGAGLETVEIDATLKTWSNVLEIEDLRSSAESAGEQVERVLEVSRQAAGQVAENTLSTHFKTIADRERKSSTILRITAVACLLVAASAGYLLSKDKATTAMLTERLSVGIPLLLLAAYFAREAAHHRKVSRWAEEIEVKLLTMDAYIEPLDKSQRNELRTDFGKQIYQMPEGSTQVPDIGLGVLGEVNGLIDRVSKRKESPS